ncbi:MAG: GntR family transcriptional regulator [Saprospiraceae bacterium]
MNLPTYIKIDRKSRIPKYKQVMDSIMQGIKDQQLLMGDKILSINALSEQYDLSRDTVEKAYSLLRSQKIIESVKGKGFYVTKTDLAIRENVLFLINKLSTYKMRIFNAFTAAIGKNVKVDLDIYHCEPEVFKNILEKKEKQYDFLVIMPHFRNENLKNVGCPDDVLSSLKKIAPEKLILLDKEIKRLPNAVGKVYQDFTDDIYSALKTALPKVKKYKKIILVYPNKALYPYPQEIVIGFRRFCAKNQLDCEVLDEIFDSMELQKEDLYIIIQESDLVNLVKQVRDKKYELGKDIGIISYNDTPLKELLGITVISTDFKKMGILAAQMIVDEKISSVKNDFNFIDRFSA